MSSKYIRKEISASTIWKSIILIGVFRKSDSLEEVEPISNLTLMASVFIVLTSIRVMSFL